MNRDPVVAGIHHVALAIERHDAQRALEFWRLIGFEQVQPPPSLSQRAIWMQAGPARSPTQIHLLFRELPPALSDGGRQSAEVEAGGHVAVVVAGFESTLAALRRAGFTVEGRRAHWGAARAYASHPGGHTVELMAAPPTDDPGRD